MPSIGVYFTDEEIPAVEAAAKVSEQRAVSPYIKAAVLVRLQKEGMLPGNPRAEVNAAIDEMGVDQALEVLRKASRRKGAQVRTLASA